MTNAQKLRRMTDDELLEQIHRDDAKFAKPQEDEPKED